MNEDEQVQLEEIQEIIGQAATWLMQSHLPMKASNFLMVLRAQSVTTHDPRQKRVLEAALQHLSRTRVNTV